MNTVFFLNSILLGVGLAMDAFSVSLANGLNDPKMKAPRMCAIAGTFAGFQALMPMLGWVCVHTVVTYFRAFESFVPWIALILLLYIGGKMLFEAIRGSGEEKEKGTLARGSHSTGFSNINRCAVGRVRDRGVRYFHGVCVCCDHCSCHVYHMYTRARARKAFRNDDVPKSRDTRRYRTDFHRDRNFCHIFF